MIYFLSSAVPEIGLKLKNTIILLQTAIKFQTNGARNYGIFFDFLFFLSYNMIYFNVLVGKFILDSVVLHISQSKVHMKL